MVKDRYFCDYCYTNKIDGNGLVKHVYYSKYQSGDYAKHLCSKKHINNKKKIVDKGDFICPYCNHTFDEGGYKNHLLRNRRFHEKWNLYKEIEPRLSCNNFIYGDNKRATSFDDWRQKISNETPVKKSKYTPIYTKASEHSSEEDNYETSSSEEEIPENFCSECNLPIYENLNKKKKNKLKNMGAKYCECVWASDTSSNYSSDSCSDNIVEI